MKKLFILTLFICATSNVFAQAPESILLKVSDIKPIKNANEETIACEFSTTVFNRSSKDLANVSLDLVWMDETIANTIDAEIKASKASSDIFARGQSKTAKLTNKKIQTTVAVPPIPAKKQVIKKQKIDTNRCFLLLNNAELKINSCKFSDTNTQNKASKSKSSDCKTAFIYVNTASPEYHTEFSDENYEALEKKEEDKIKKDISEINDIYNQSQNAIRKLNDTINAM